MEQDQDAAVTVCIVNWNSGDDLLACTRALAAHTRIGLDLIVVDNGSEDASLERFVAAGVRGRVFRLGRNLGFAGGVNAALAQVSTPFALLLNPDARVHEGCVEALLARAQQQPRAGAVGAGLRYPDGRLQPAARNFPTPLTHFVEAFRLYHVLRHVPGIGRRYLLLSRQDRARTVDWVVGACMLLRMDAVRAVGSFDESFFMYAEEADWCLRATRAGWEIWLEPAAVATHTLGGSSRHNELPLMVESYRSMYRFYAKHYPAAWGARARLVTRAAMVARACALPFRGRRSRARLQAYRDIAKL
ncbi:MAG TPA: glycosyltransferase family 2 protein [Candidatus Sulfotelmatobacter sp.]|nr:glycosyltransferase family 2 protein [Candidatus Sulfotelmatobacter sp.]